MRGGWGDGCSGNRSSAGDVAGCASACSRGVPNAVTDFGGVCPRDRVNV